MNHENSDGSSAHDTGIEMYESPWNIIIEALQKLAFAFGCFCLGVALAIAFVWVTGLVKYFFN